MSKSTLFHTPVTKFLRSKRVLVVGDFMLDVYTMGKVKRISPEAPVPVLCVTEEHALAGGAGNAVLNLCSLGMEVRVLGRVGDDPAGRELMRHLQSESVDISHLVIDSQTPTPKKNRMMADSHQLLRVDYENPLPLSVAVTEQIIASLPSLLDGVEMIAISDYGKGFLTPRLLKALIVAAEVPVIVDPKGMDFTRYSGADIIKPNLSEAFAAAGLGVEATLQDVAHKILQDVKIEALVITRSQDGISIFEQGGKQSDYPARVHEVRDVTGAGDTVLAVMTAALANKCSLGEAAELGNRAAAIAIERVGCARVSIADLDRSFKEDEGRETVVDCNSENISNHQNKRARSNLWVKT